MADEQPEIAVGNSLIQTDIRRHGSLNTFTTCVFIVGIMAGSGFLALPKSVDGTGWIGIILLLSFCFLCTYTSSLLGKCWIMMLEMGLLPPSGHVRNPYPAIGEAAYGQFGKILVRAATNFTNFGTVVVYILIASQNIESLLHSYTGLRMCYIALIVCGCVIPVTFLGTPKDFCLSSYMYYLKRNQHGLTSAYTVYTRTRGTALAASLCTFIASVLVFSNILLDRPKYPNLIHNDITVVTFFMAFGTMGFSYGGHPVFPTVLADMREPRHFVRASLAGYLVLLLIYLPSSIASFFVYGKHVDPNVLTSISAGPMRTIATVLMTVHLLFGIIIVINPVCQDVEQLLNIPDRFTVKRAITRTCVSLSALFIAETIPHFSAILALVGGSTITLLSFVCPPLFYLRLASRSPEVGDTWVLRRVPLHIRILNYEITLVGAICGVAATYSAIRELLESSFSVPCYVNPSRASI